MYCDNPQTPQQIALNLMGLIETIEKKDNSIKQDRAYYVALYAECLEAVSGKRVSTPPTVKTHLDDKKNCLRCNGKDNDVLSFGDPAKCVTCGRLLEPDYIPYAAKMVKIDWPTLPKNTWIDYQYGVTLFPLYPAKIRVKYDHDEKDQIIEGYVHKVAGYLTDPFFKPKAFMILED